VNTQSEALVCPFGTFSLARYPETSDRSLRAWDAADEYLLDHLAEHEQMADASDSSNEAKRILVVNDTFGALSCALDRYEVHHWSDSILSQRAVS